MKHLLLTVMCAVAPAAAQVFPGYLNYQGKLGDASGNPLTGTYSFQFNLYNQASGGTLLFADTNYTGGNAVSVVNGVYSVQIGSLTAGGIPVSAFFNSEVWLEVHVNAGTTLAGAETLTPRERLTTSPFAFLASNAEYLGSGVAIATFTAAGNLLVPGSVSASSITTTGGVFGRQVGVTAAGDTNNPAINYGAGSSGIYFGSSEVGLSAGGSGNDVQFFPASMQANNGGFYLKTAPGSAAAPNFSFPSYLGTGMFSNAGMANQLGFATNGVERARVDASGNVGVGTTSPAAALEVSSATAGGTTNPILIVSTGSAAAQRVMVVQGNGNVGIGTTAPAARLQVAGAIQARNIALGVTPTTTGTWSTLPGNLGNATDGNTATVTTAGQTTQTAIGLSNINIDLGAVYRGIIYFQGGAWASGGATSTTVLSYSQDPAFNNSQWDAWTNTCTAECPVFFAKPFYGRYIAVSCYTSNATNPGNCVVYDLTAALYQ